jgi:hypothetical protein
MQAYFIVVTTMRTPKKSTMKTSYGNCMHLHEGRESGSHYTKGIPSVKSRSSPLQWVRYPHPASSKQTKPLIIAFYVIKTLLHQQFLILKTGILVCKVMSSYQGAVDTMPALSVLQ